MGNNYAHKHAKLGYNSIMYVKLVPKKLLPESSFQPQLASRSSPITQRRPPPEKSSATLTMGCERNDEFPRSAINIWWIWGLSAPKVINVPHPKMYLYFIRGILATQICVHAFTPYAEYFWAQCTNDGYFWDQWTNEPIFWLQFGRVCNNEEECC